MMSIADKTINWSAIYRLIIPSSLVAKVSDIEVRQSQGVVILTEFRLARGAWIVQAKATVEGGWAVFDPKDPVSVSVTANLILVADAGDFAVDVAIVDTDWRHATSMAVIGFNTSSTVLVELKVSCGGFNHKAKFSDIVITAIKQDELITLEM